MRIYDSSEPSEISDGVATSKADTRKRVAKVLYPITVELGSDYFSSGSVIFLKRGRGAVVLKLFV